MITVIADDLSGAAEAAEQFRLRGHDVAVHLETAVQPEARERTSHPVTVVDTDSRSLDPASARAAVTARLTLCPPDGLLVKKIDSLWRGNIATEVQALQDAGYRVVIAGPLPALDRTVVEGLPLADGIPLHDSLHWALEEAGAPHSVAEALGHADPSRGAGTAHIGLAAVRGDDLAGTLHTALAEAEVVIVDGETDPDVAAVVAALWDGSSPISDIALVGTAALAAAVAAHVAPAPTRASDRLTGSAPRDGGRQDNTTTGTLVVVGTGSTASAQQLAVLATTGIPVVAFDPRRPESADGDVSALLTEAVAAKRTAVIALTSPERVDPRDAVRRLAGIAVGAVGRDPGLDLVLTGGETARCVLDLLGVDSLRPLGQVEHGAVVSVTVDGRLVATKPGSFGSIDVFTTLLTSLRRLRGSRTPDPTFPPHSGDLMDTPVTEAPDARPFIAVTMGDGAGVGPEITVGALLDAAAYRDARPVVIGDTERLRMGAAALGAQADVVEIADIDDAVFSPGRINVIDPHLLSRDLAWGEVSAEAGNAAFHYIRIACELGMAGKVQGICTAPLNKAALHEAGHIYPGHTELLAHFMGVGEVSMMLSTPKIKVIHVTTHIGLIDAIAKIEPGLVERTVRRGWEALRRAGVEDPTIGVCAINPHAGENGLFGYGEEAEKITPAIEILQAEGMRVAGPLPADTAFFLGGRGDYDLIVAMYHDQGHGPVKVLGIEAGVNITVGLPVIRTSVDHGTAFDIAGTGRVAIGSMIEALRQAVEMAPSPVSPVAA